MLQKKKLTEDIKLNEQIDKQLKEKSLKKGKKKEIKALDQSSSGEQIDISKSITFPQLCLRAAKCQNNRIKRTEELQGVNQWIRPIPTTILTSTPNPALKSLQWMSMG